MADSQSGDQALPPHSENVDEELQRIHRALSAVFSTSTSHNQGHALLWWQQRHLADRYLTSFQGTALSWLVCDRLLQEGDVNNTQDMGVQQQRRFFAAQTLHTKCRSDIHELPESSLASLRDSLLAHLNRYVSAGSTALTTRLAMCVSALAIQLGWNTIVNDLLANVANRKLFMFVLRVLPEECASDRLILIDENSRYRMRDHLVSASSVVFQFLQASMQEGDHPVQVFEALHTWIRYVPAHPASIVESPLLQASVQAMTQPQYLEHAADVVVEILRMYPSHHYGNEALVKAMIPLLAQLPLDDALRSDDEDVLRAYTRVFTEIGESYMSLILSPQHADASQLVGWVLKCSGISDVDIASITLHFWYRLVMDLEGIEPYDWRQELVDAYTPHLLQLIDVCATILMRFPADIDDAPEDRVDDLKRHRFYVSETIEDCCRLLGGQHVLHRIGTHLRLEVQKASGTHHSDWQGLESCLACIGAMHRFIPSDEGEVLPSLFALIPQLPPDIRPLRFTASKTIGKFAAFLAVHSDLLQPLLPYLAQGLSIPECASPAAVAIKELCECSNQNFAIAEPVLSLYHEMTAQPGRLELHDELQILEGVCRALSRQIQDTRGSGAEFLTRLAQPIGSRLVLLVADTNASPRKIIPEIDRLTLIVQYLTVPATTPNAHPMIDLIQSTWSLLDAATNRFPGDNMLAEKVCRLHKHALRTCGAAAYAPMLEPLIQQLVRSFERSHQAPFLYAASICITEYAQDPARATLLYEMVAAMATTAFSFLRTLEELTNHPDVVEEFFYLMGRMMSYCPDPLARSSLLQSLFQCAVVGMQLDHHGANKGTIKFLEHTISYGLSLREQNKPECQAALEQVLSQEGHSVVANLVRAMMGDLPAYSNQIPEILWKLNLLCPGLLSQWLNAAFDATTLPERAKNDFMGALDTGLARDEFSLAVRAFQSACARERRLMRKS
jgi:transportin-3